MRRRDFILRLGSATALTLPVGALMGRASAKPSLRAWTHATIWTGDGEVIEDGVLVVADERISSLSKAGPIPAGAEIIEARGATITPGWVATETPLGLVEIELEPSTVDARPRGDARPDAIRAAFSAADGYNPASSLLAVARREGVTSVVSTPDGGLVSGTSAWADLGDQFSGPALEREALALHANLFEGADNSRPLALSRLREAFESARVFARSPRAYDLGQTRELGLSVLDLQRLAQVQSGALPLVVRVARASDILRLFELRKTYPLQLILSGAEEGWSVAPQIAALGVPVIIDPTENLPVSFSRLGVRRENAALLSAAGVSVIFSTFDAYTAHNLRQLAGNAVAAGVTRRSAVRALALEPALAFGMAKQHGLLARGKLANFSVWNGDPFELSTWATAVVIKGRDVTTRSRQSALFDRYRDLSQVPRGRGLAPSER